MWMSGGRGWVCLGVDGKCGSVGEWGWLVWGGRVGARFDALMGVKSCKRVALRPSRAVVPPTADPTAAPKAPPTPAPGRPLMVVIELLLRNYSSLDFSSKSHFSEIFPALSLMCRLPRAEPL